MRARIAVALIVGAASMMGLCVSAASAGVWSVQPTPNPAGGTFVMLNGVSCASSDTCIAVGDYYNSVGAQVPLSELWHAGVWVIEPTPNPSAATSTVLARVSCSSTSACTAVGYSTSAAGTQTAIAERWDGTAWHIQSTPVPSGATSSSLDGVSCRSAHACMSVGDTINASTEQRPLAERWDGGAWHIVPTPTPPGTLGSVLNGVSCPRGRACVAVGLSFTTGTSESPLAEHWNGSHWTIQSTPAPSGAPSSYLGDVSCSAENACTAVGGSLIERWNGTAWTAQAPAPTHPASSRRSHASRLTRVPRWGSSTPIRSGAIRGSAERWDGRRWTRQATPSPGTVVNLLNGVSCRPTVSNGPLCARPSETSTAGRSHPPPTSSRSPSASPSGHRRRPPSRTPGTSPGRRPAQAGAADPGGGRSTRSSGVSHARGTAGR